MAKFWLWSIKRNLGCWRGSRGAYLNCCCLENNLSEGKKGGEKNLLIFKYWKASPRTSRIICSPKVECKVEEAMGRLHWWGFILRIRKENLCYGKDKILKYLVYGDCGISVTGDHYEQCFQRSATYNASIILPWSQRLVIFLDFCYHFSVILLTVIWYKALYHIYMTLSDKSSWEDVQKTEHWSLSLCVLSAH